MGMVAELQYVLEETIMSIHEYMRTVRYNDTDSYRRERPISVEALQAQVDAYLAKGNEIEQVPIGATAYTANWSEDFKITSEREMHRRATANAKQARIEKLKARGYNVS